MNKELAKTLLRRKRLTNIIFLLSSLALTFVLTLNYSVFIEYEGCVGSDYQVRPDYAAAAVLIMIPVYAYLIKKTDIVASAIEKSSKLTFIIACAATVFVVLQVMLDAQKNYSHILLSMQDLIKNRFMEQKGYQLILMGMGIGSCMGVFIFVLSTANVLRRFFADFIREADSFERHYFVVAMLFCLCLICFMYARTRAPYDTLDRVYQTDTNFIYKHYYPVFSYGFDFDWDFGCGGIRHPLATMLTYPVYVVTEIISMILYGVPNLRPILYAVFHSVLLVMSAITLKRLTKSAWAAVVYSFSFPFVFYSFFLEKYQLAVFLMLMFVYAVMRGEKKDVQKYFLIASGGMMLTSCAYGFCYGEEKKPLARLKEYVGVGLAFLGTLVATGRIHYIINFFYLKDLNFSQFFDAANAANTLFNRFAGYSNLIASTLVPVDYFASPWAFYWTDLTGAVNGLGVVILLFVVLSMLLNRRERLTRVLALWVMWGAVQIIGMGIGVGSDPLFSLYLTWPILALMVMGVNKIFKKQSTRALIYVPMLFVMFYLNLVHLHDLLKFMLGYPPL